MLVKMISSIPNFFCCITKPCRNKVILRNESNYVVKYEAYIYRGASISKIDAAIGAGSFNGKTALEIIQGEEIKPEVRCIPKNGSVHVTCDYGGKIAIRYFMIDLHTDYTDELANFQVLDVVIFTQPEQGEIVNIERKRKEEKKQMDKNELCSHQCAISENFRDNCSTNEPRIYCKLCNHWYCKYHSKPGGLLDAKCHWCP